MKADAVQRAALADPASIVPLYHQVYAVLREQILEGRFDAAPIPGETTLAADFGVARVTVRRAMQQLAAEGLVARERGRGTFARRPQQRRRARPVKAELSGLLENLVSMGLKTDVRVLDLATVGATDEVAAELSLAPGALVQKAVRVRSYEGEPLSHITTFVPDEIARHFGARELASVPILTLIERAGTRIGGARQRVSATLADAVVSRHLAVPVGSALLSVTRRVVDARGRPVQWLRGLYRPDRYEYEMELTRVGRDSARVWVDKTLSANYR